MTHAARNAEAAADALLAWLDLQNTAAAETPDAIARPAPTSPVATSERRSADLALADTPRPQALTDPDAGPITGAAPPARDDRENGATGRAAAMAPAHTDWLFHHHEIAGPADALRSFQRAACGAGVIPWHLDLDRLQEDFFLLLAAPPQPQARTLGAAGARILAAELRAAVARRHEIAVARVGSSRACPFDLHALLPLPGEILRLGPDHPQALIWLWTHWGTTQSLRHVTARPGPPDGTRAGLDAGEARLQLCFWSADWTPWRALLALQARWPSLRWQLRPSYEAT